MRCEWWALLVLFACLLACLLATFLPRACLSDSFETQRKSCKGGKQECGEQDGYAMRWVNADDKSDKARFGKSFFSFLLPWDLDLDGSRVTVRVTVCEIRSDM